LIASYHPIRFGNQELEFPQKGRFQLLFSPNFYLRRTTVKVIKLIKPKVFNTDFKENTLESLNRIESKIDGLNDFEITSTDASN
jgi:hypothetical protein